MGVLEEMEAVALCRQWRMMRLRLSCTYGQFRSWDTISKMCKPWIMLWPWGWISKQKARGVLLVLFSSLVSLPGLEPPAVNKLLADLNGISSKWSLRRITRCFPVTSVYQKLPLKMYCGGGKLLSNSAYVFPDGYYLYLWLLPIIL